MIVTRCIQLALILSGLVGSAAAYPIDGYAETGIRRLERLRMIAGGELTGPGLPSGGTIESPEIKLNLIKPERQGLNRLPEADAAFQKEVEALFPDRHESYSIAILDVTPGREIKAAYYQDLRTFAPGSVGKLAVAAGLFAELKKIFPDDEDARRQLLKERMVVASDWAKGDEHVVPIFDPVSRRFESRPIQDGDTFSLYEWLDHALSASANSAASTVWKEVVLMRAFGAAYPPSLEEEERYFEKTSKSELGRIGFSVVNDPLREMGIEQKDWQLGSLFTKTGQRRIPSSGGSRANPRGLLTFLLRVEQGRAIDVWSSLELKRMMYMTAKRIRYASSPRLSKSAVYYKSGSLYRCAPEPDYKCRKYEGNVENAMNSVSIVERPDGRVYLVSLMSNVLRKNSAVDHQTLATLIDKLVQ